MASRQEEKERRKQERIERERAEAAAAQRKRLIQIVAGVVVAAAVVVGIVLATMGGKDKSGPDKSPTPKVAIPPRQITDLEDAAKAASCVLTNPPIEGNNHVTTKVKYKTNPPTSGDHAPPQQVAKDGDYAGVVPPRPEQYVHSLEHGRIIIQYKPGLPQRRVDQLETLFAENSKTDSGLDSIKGSYTLLLPNNTKMQPEVAATAWGHMLACAKFNDKVFDAIRAFRQRYVLQAPEKITEPE